MSHSGSNNTTTMKKPYVETNDRKNINHIKFSIAFL